MLSETGTKTISRLLFMILYHHTISTLVHLLQKESCQKAIKMKMKNRKKKVCLFVSHIFSPFVLHHNKTEKYESTRHNGLIFYIRLDISPSAKLVWLMILLLYSFFSVIFHISLFLLVLPPPTTTTAISFSCLPCLFTFYCSYHFYQ